MVRSGCLNLPAIQGWAAGHPQELAILVAVALEILLRPPVSSDFIPPFSTAWAVGSPVVGNREGDLEFGKELEILLFSLLCEARPHQQHPQVFGSDHPVLCHGP